MTALLVSYRWASETNEDQPQLAAPHGADHRVMAVGGNRVVPVDGASAGRAAKELGIAALGQGRGTRAGWSDRHDWQPGEVWLLKTTECRFTMTIVRGRGCGPSCQPELGIGS